MRDIRYVLVHTDNQMVPQQSAKQLFVRKKLYVTTLNNSEQFRFCIKSAAGNCAFYVYTVPDDPPWTGFFFFAYLCIST